MIIKILIRIQLLEYLFTIIYNNFRPNKTESLDIMLQIKMLLIITM